MTAHLILSLALALAALTNLYLGDYTRALFVGVAALLMGYWDYHRKSKQHRRKRIT